MALIFLSLVAFADDNGAIAVSFLHCRSVVSKYLDELQHHQIGHMILDMGRDDNISLVELCMA